MYTTNNDKRDVKKMLNMYVNSPISAYEVTSNEENMEDRLNNVEAVVINQSYNNIHAKTFTDRHETNENNLERTLHLNSRQFDILESCLKNDLKPIFCSRRLNPNNHQNSKTSNALGNGIRNKPVINKSISSESYYSQPPHCKYNDDFTYGTMQTNVKLKKLLNRVVTECYREKQKVLWNNYINELKEKHGYYKDESLKTYHEIYCNNELMWQPSEEIRYLLNDIYECQKKELSNDEFDHVAQITPEIANFKHSYCCYPTSSQTPIKITSQKGRHNKNYYRRYDGDRRLNRHCITSNTIFNRSNKTTHTETTVDVQTDINLLNFNNHSFMVEQDHVSEKRKVTTDIMDPLRRNCIRETDNSKKKDFQSVEEKLNTLIHSVDSVIVAMSTLIAQKEKVSCLNTTRLNCKLKPMRDRLNDTCHILINRTRNQRAEVEKMDNEFITLVFQNPSRHLSISEFGTSMSQFREFTTNKMNGLMQENEKNKQVERDIQELLQTRCDRQHSVQLEFDIPTKETKVLNCHENEYYFEVHNDFTMSKGKKHENRQLTAAVNTDPLSLLALWQVSTDAIKQLISYMPQVNFRSYLAMFQLQRPCITNYICYICEDSFSCASHLSDHVRRHHLRRTRKCCLRSQNLSTQFDQIGQRQCEYCGKRFTRAYCCELHQQSCAKLYGKTHDRCSSLMYLK